MELMNALVGRCRHLEVWVLAVKWQPFTEYSLIFNVSKAVCGGAFEATLSEHCGNK